MYVQYSLSAMTDPKRTLMLVMTDRIKTLTTRHPGAMRLGPWMPGDGGWNTEDRRLACVDAVLTSLKQHCGSYDLQSRGSLLTI